MQKTGNVINSITFSLKRLRMISILQENLSREDHDLQLLLQDILVNNLRPYKCVVIICDSVYVHIFRSTWFQKFELFISYFLASRKSLFLTISLSLRQL